MWWIPLRPRLVKDPMWRILLKSRLVLGPYGGLVWARTLKTWKSIGFTVFSLKIVEKALVLQCFGSKLLKKHWFYNVLAPKCWKSIGFTVFSLQNVEKALVLQCFGSKMLKKHWFYCVFAPKCWKSIGFTNKEALKPKNHWFYSVPYVNEEQNAKKWKNHYVL